MSSVLYGLYDSKSLSLRLSPNENKLGGYPDFYRECFLTSPPSCECCNSPLVLVVQLYCPLEGSPYNRKLHIFSCTQRVCWSNSKSWLVLRSQSLDPSYISQRAMSPDPHHGHNLKSPLDTALLDEWCNGACNWESEDPYCNDKAADQDTLTLSCETLSVRNQGKEIDVEAPEAIPAESSSTVRVARSSSEDVPPYHGPSYPSAYIQVVEGWTGQSDSKQVSELLQKYSLENPECPVVVKHGERKGGGGGNRARRKVEGAGGEGYEIATARHGDRAFLKFQKELAKCSHQILRYSWKGKAILMKWEEPEIQVEACPICGAERVYECQLMPQMVYIFKKKLCSSTPGTLGKKVDESPPSRSPQDSVEFGTVLVYSCSQSCWDNTTQQQRTLTSTNLDKFRQEYVIIQTETE